jgi:hypothetical protein
MLGDLRARTAACTTEAEFVDVDGLSYEGCQAKRFSSANGAGGITVINQTDKPSWARVQLEGVNPKQLLLERLDGSTLSAGRCHDDRADLDVMLEPRECAVWHFG